MCFKAGRSIWRVKRSAVVFVGDDITPGVALLSPQRKAKRRWPSTPRPAPRTVRAAGAGLIFISSKTVSDQNDAIGLACDGVKSR